MKDKMTPRIDRRAVVLGLAAAPFMPQSSKADVFPSRPIRLIVPFGPGSIADIIARKAGGKAGEDLKQSFVVENCPGAGGTIGASIAAAADPDGYTICLGTVASHGISLAMMEQHYDVAASFKGVTLLVTATNLIVVHKDVPVTTLPEYLEWARKKGSSSYVSGGVATTTQLIPELIRVRLNVPLKHIAAARVGDSFNDLLAGRVDMMCYPAIALQPYIETGSVKVLAVAASNRIKQYPNVPTVKEALGSSEFDLTSWFGVFAPTKTPEPIIKKLSAVLSSAVLSLSDELEKIGVQAEGWDSDKFDAFFRSEIPRWAEIVRITGVKEQH